MGRRWSSPNSEACVMGPSLPSKAHDNYNTSMRVVQGSGEICLHRVQSHREKRGATCALPGLPRRWISRFTARMSDWSSAIARTSHASSNPSNKTPNRPLERPGSSPPVVPDAMAALASSGCVVLQRLDVWTCAQGGSLKRFVGPMTTSDELIHRAGPGRSWRGRNPVG